MKVGFVMQNKTSKTQTKVLTDKNCSKDQQLVQCVFLPIKLSESGNRLQFNEDYNNQVP